MSDFWELGNAFGFKDEEPKKKKKKKKDKKGKEGKKNKDKKHESEKVFQPVKKDMPYSDFLKEGKNGLYLARCKTSDGKTLECVIVKVSDHFKYPMVALTEDGLTYKDWIRKEIEKHGLNETANKIMYNSRVEKITGLCQSFIADVIAKTFEKDEEDDE